MDYTTILRISDVYRKDFYLYSSENISRRIYEERARAELFGKAFTYAEIPFSNLVRSACNHENERKVWKAILYCLASELRGSDIRGFAENNRGIALLLLDSEEASLDRFIRRIEKELDRRNLLKYLDGFDAVQKNAFRYEPSSTTEDS